MARNLESNDLVHIKYHSFSERIRHLQNEICHLQQEDAGNSFFILINVFSLSIHPSKYCSYDTSWSTVWVIELLL